MSLYQGSAVLMSQQYVVSSNRTEDVVFSVTLNLVHAWKFADTSQEFRFFESWTKAKWWPRPQCHTIRGVVIPRIQNVSTSNVDLDYCAYMIVEPGFSTLPKLRAILVEHRTKLTMYKL